MIVEGEKKSIFIDRDARMKKIFAIGGMRLFIQNNIENIVMQGCKKTFILPFCAGTSLPWLMRMYFGDSGQNGKVIIIKIAGISGMTKRNGHLSLVPKTCGKPKACETRIEIVMTSWYIVPTAPLRCSGDISDKYIGANPAFKPKWK